MFKETAAFCSFSVDNILQAKSFYHKTLGLNVLENNGLLNLDIAGGSRIIIYPKLDHKPAAFTVLNFMVMDIEKSVEELKRRGVQFEKYKEKNITTDDNGIMHNGDHNIAWFKDPAGNILSVIEKK